MGMDMVAHPNNIATRFKKGHPFMGRNISLLYPDGVRGDKNPSWKGDRVGYQGIHRWLNTNFGKASKCEYPDCKYPRRSSIGKILKAPKGFVWAKLEDKNYERRRENFWQLCHSCHFRYDETGKRGWIKRYKNINV